AGTLSRAGFDVVVTNRSAAKADAVAEATGARAVRTPREVAGAAEVVISMLADDEAVVSVYGGSDGLVAGLSAGEVVLEMSTIDPSTVASVRPAVASAGAELLDAPVSGSVSLVEQGALTVMAGGPPSALERARPVLDALAARTFHVGPSGAGATVKLAVNSLVH